MSSFAPPKNNQPDSIKPGIPQNSIKEATRLIQRFEGFREEAYQCPNGIMTVGWGFTKIGEGSNRRDVRSGDFMSRGQADETLSREVKLILHQMLDRLNGNKDLLSGFNKLSDNCKAALLSFAYNVGPNFPNSDGFETITRAIKSGKTIEVANALLKYTNGSIPGLINRRNAESELALKGRVCQTRDVNGGVNQSGNLPSTNVDIFRRLLRGTN